MMSHVSENLKEAMENAGLTVSELSYDARVPYQRVYYILNNKTPNPRVETLKKIADALGVTVDQLLKDRGEA